MTALILSILISASLYLITFWIYGYCLHRIKQKIAYWQAAYYDECDRHIASSLEHSYQLKQLNSELNQVPLSIRNHYSK